MLHHTVFPAELPIHDGGGEPGKVEPGEPPSSRVTETASSVTPSLDDEDPFAEAWHKRRSRPPYREYGKANASAAADPTAPLAGALVCGHSESADDAALAVEAPASIDTLAE